MNQSKRLTEGALLIAIFIGLILVSVFVPVLSFFAMFVLPVPFVIYASRYDWRPSLIMLAVSMLLSILFATIFSLPITLLMGLGGIMIGSAIYRQLTPYETWARGTFGFIIGLLFAFVFTQYVFGVNWVNELESMMNESMDMTINTFEQFGMGEQTEEAREMLEASLDMLVNLLPVFIALIAIGLAFLSQWVSYKIIRRLDNKEIKFPPFRHLRFPVSLIWVYFFALIITLIVSEQSNIFHLAAENLLVLTGVLMAIQGFSFIFYYAHHKNMSKAIPILIVVLTILFPMLFFYLVRILGIIDLGFGLRDRLSKKE
ncbi:YybS family protein [Virgibacillus halodenitrificans]|jgi:uncharacterized protein YybS (DUF2232 family)|uniref:YybS family protein n=1 Tax=Virgibacillus halodenitrificans TaxID=1482 RepID=UPI001F2C7D60|nr:YybS family protein [Virgibacillus halodenitrificans]